MRSRLRPSALILESGQAVHMRDVVAMLSPSSLAAAATREFLSSWRAKGLVDELAAPASSRSGIVCVKQVILSRESTATLLRKLR